MVIYEYMVFLFEIIIFCFSRIFIKRDIEQELLILRKEVLILKRKNPRPRLSNIDRWFFIALLRQSKSLANKLLVVKPATIIKWHKALVSKKWDYSKRKIGRPKTSMELKDLVVEMKKSNPRWGIRKIHGALKKLGIALSKDTIRKILKEAGFDPTKRNSGPTWLDFLRLSCPHYIACDFFTVETILLTRLYVFFIIDATTKELIHFGVTKNPDRKWLTNTVRSGFMGLESIPSYLVSDRDGIFGNWFSEFLQECYDIKLYRTPPQTPNCNAFAERMVRTFREELTDRCLVFSEDHLRLLINEYFNYYNGFRSHSSLNFDTPLLSFPKPTSKEIPKHQKKKMVFGTVCDFSLVA